MSTSEEVNPVFHGVGQKEGLEIWHIDDFKAVPLPASQFGKFYTGDSYIVLKTTASKDGKLQHDIHYWLGKDTTEDESGSAAIYTVELDTALGGHAVQYREVQGQESAKFISYFKPAIVAKPGGVKSGFRHVEVNESDHVTRLYVVKVTHTTHVDEVPVDRSSLSHNDIFILDAENKIYQFNGKGSSIRERGEAMNVVDHIKDSFHNGVAEVVTVEDEESLPDDDSAKEFWSFFGGFGLISEHKSSADHGKEGETATPQLFSFTKDMLEPVHAESLDRELLHSDKCYLLKSGIEAYIWVGKDTSLQERKNVVQVVEKKIHEKGKTKFDVVRVSEGFETVIFKSKFSNWPESSE